MGKILKGIALLAASAVGTYYYKNPKELEKHKDILKENIDLGLEKVNDLIKPEAQEKLEDAREVAEEKAEDFEEKVEEAKEAAQEKLEDFEEEVEEVFETSKVMDLI